MEGMYRISLFFICLAAASLTFMSARAQTASSDECPIGSTPETLGKAQKCTCKFQGGAETVDVNEDDDATAFGLAAATGVLGGTLVTGGIIAAYLHCKKPSPNSARRPSERSISPLGDESGKSDSPRARSDKDRRRPSSVGSNATNIYRHAKVWPGNH